MTRYVVENHDATGRVVEILRVTDLYNMFGERTSEVIQAVSCVVSDGTCHHAVDLSVVPIYSVH